VVKTKAGYGLALLFTFILLGAAAHASISLSGPSTITVTQGSQVAASIQLTKQGGGKPETATFSVTGLPSGASAKFSPATCKPTCSTTLTVSATTATPTASYPISVKAQTPRTSALLGITLVVKTSGGLMANYFVTTGGNDTTGDGSVGNPWASLHKACSVATTSGDIISVAGGSYTDNTQCVLAVGVKIVGAGSGTTLITTSADPYILASTAVPVVDGSNEISAIGFTGSGSNLLISSHGRSNQKIHDNSFTNGNVLLEGVTPRSINPADGSETGDAVSAGPNEAFSIEPFSTSWAQNCEIYNNTGTNTNIKLNTIKNALIHDNVINNSGGARSCWGSTSYFWSGVQFYNNEYHTSSSTVSNIGIEVWHIEDDTKFYNNVMDGWASLILNTGGGNTPYSMEIYDNNFSMGNSTGINNELEIGYYGMRNVRVSGNFFYVTDATTMSGVTVRATGIVDNIWIYDNVIYNTGGPGIILKPNVSTNDGIANPGNMDNIYIYNNVFDNMDSGGSAAIRVEADNIIGDIDGIYVRNNIFVNLTYGVLFQSTPHTSSGNFYDHNIRDAATSGTINANGIASFTVGAGNITGNPGILSTGDRWTNYYKPSVGSNLIDAGVNVGLPYTGTAPDIGLLEDQQAAQSGLVIHWAAQ